MRSFNVLDRNESIHRHAMLEASAGTGKTFAIENIVVRLLIGSGPEALPPALERLLVVTFTKAAARDLKARIRANLSKCLDALNRLSAGKEPLGDIPDYLLAHIENGSESVELARRRIENGLFAFEQAQLFTIHGFCWRMLRCFAIEAGIGLEAAYEEGEPQIKIKLQQAVRDFLRTELIPESYSHQQLKIVHRKFGSHSESLQTELLRNVAKGLPITPPASLEESVSAFQSAMASLKSNWTLAAEKIEADFMKQAPFYKGINGKDKKIKPEVLLKIRNFSNLFEKSEWTVEDLDLLIGDGLLFVEALAPQNLHSRRVPLDPVHLHYPGFGQALADALGEIIADARDVNRIFARMAADCQQFLRNYQDQEELLGYNELIEKMHEACLNPVFADKVRSSFDAVIVDEFQDTDPMQWAVFCKLFRTEQTWNGFLYLVGDPKQSIYAFRQADIYTYLSAAKAIGDEDSATLDTNFRSQPLLVDALNTLFQSASNLFPLPKIHQNLAFRAVYAGKKEARLFSDGMPCLQFWLADDAEKRRISLHDYETGYFFPAIAREIMHLHENDGIAFRQCAVLVADRFQAERLMRYLKERTIPVISQKGIDLATSEAVASMRELLHGILHFRHASSLKTALAGKMIGMRNQEILMLEKEEFLHGIMEQCDKLRNILIKDGFACFYTTFLQSSWHGDGKCMLERLMGWSGADEFYSEFQDIAELLILEQGKNNLSPEGLLEFLDTFQKLAANDDARMKAFTNQEKDGVAILTSHVSKGLEFDIVFTLGLIKRTEVDEMLAPAAYGGTLCLAAMQDKASSAYLQYCSEIDAEKMRQLYVAFTRAKYRLYIPFALRCGSAAAEIGQASPSELFLVRLAAEGGTSDQAEIYLRINSASSTPLAMLSAKHPSLMKLRMLERNVFEEAYSGASELPHLASPCVVDILCKPRFVQSFTSLARISKVQATEKLIDAPHDFCAEIKNPHTLPAGSDTGVFLHSLFEKIPFGRFAEASSPEDLTPLITPRLNGTPLEGWHAVFADLAFSAFRAPLPGSGPQFCLADVDPAKIFCEAEFLFPQDGEVFGAELKPGFVKGVIDLMFEHRGKYYILDWKSNWLGPSNEHYGKTCMEQAMLQHDYYLQARLYGSALKRYLKLFDKRPFHELFGGAYYCFLRGIGPETGILRDVWFSKENVCI